MQDKMHHNIELLGIAQGLRYQRYNLESKYLKTQRVFFPGDSIGTVLSLEYGGFEHTSLLN
jgi:hypothetical protein